MISGSASPCRASSDAQLLIRPSQLCCAGYARQIVDLPSLVGFADLMPAPLSLPITILPDLPLMLPKCFDGADKRVQTMTSLCGGQREGNVPPAGKGHDALCTPRLLPPDEEAALRDE